MQYGEPLRALKEHVSPALQDPPLAHTPSVEHTSQPQLWLKLHWYVPGAQTRPPALAVQYGYPATAPYVHVSDAAQYSVCSHAPPALHVSMPHPREGSFLHRYLPGLHSLPVSGAGAVGGVGTQYGDPFRELKTHVSEAAQLPPLTQREEVSQTSQPQVLSAFWRHWYRAGVQTAPGSGLVPFVKRL